MAEEHINSHYKLYQHLTEYSQVFNVYRTFIASLFRHHSFAIAQGNYEPGKLMFCLA